ncbi:hypothetical protein L207DRAFT_589213 [Hyaloscypha variabilis F]|uniref:Zn(2)-C6 fungal-type domain-containing protein n=1 Tax=Hyaloscypha variabilis (strain UAMH 11265 / GT02V1 / F) TaxID=1149755 RepID=A0A2J6R552_HYAVF|nr:hypothetical protein L207DRAFT_589213 [Hyaloscypha variabilis F]
MTVNTPLSPPASATSPPPSTQSPSSERNPEAPSRKRRKAPKVKTGCLTCRSRRVKCDETHPTCRKCQKIHVPCTYALPIIKPRSRARQACIALPPLVAKDFPKPSLPLGRHVKAGPRFTDEHEARYFVYYCEGISKKIGGPFKSKLWVQLIPQAGEGTPFIGRAVIALGALSLSLSQASQDQEKHRRYALQQYGSALHGMRKSIKDTPTPTPSTIRTALIGCLLVFIFESLQGHAAAASAHAASGSNLITSLCRYRCAPRSWRESELGEELYGAFSGLNLQSLLFADAASNGESKSTRAAQAFYKNGLSEAASGMPESFGVLEECRRFWHYIMRRNLHFCREVRDFFSLSLEPTQDEDREEKVRALEEERDRYVQQICKWEIASAPLLCRLYTSSHNTDSEDFLIASLLRIHAALSIILLTHSFNPPETIYSKFHPQFRTIVELSERIHPLLVQSSDSDECGKAGTFRFDVGILPALSQATLLCRDREFRDRAVGLLGRSKGYKEGIWDADAVRAVGEWVRGVEEEGLSDGGEVEDGMMVSVLGCEMRVEECWAKVRIRRADGVEQEGLVKW